MAAGSKSGVVRHSKDLPVEKQRSIGPVDHAKALREAVRGPEARRQVECFVDLPNPEQLRVDRKLITMQRLKMEEDGCPIPVTAYNDKEPLFRQPRLQAGAEFRDDASKASVMWQASAYKGMEQVRRLRLACLCCAALGDTSSTGPCKCSQCSRSTHHSSCCHTR